MNIAGLNKADVIAVLYNAAKPQGFGFMQYDPTPMTSEEAQQYVNSSYFDYLKGRVMKISVQEDEVDTRLYNRDNGPDAAEIAIEAFRNTSDVNVAAEIHERNTRIEAQKVSSKIDEPTVKEGSTIHLGYDSNPVLKEAVERYT